MYVLQAQTATAVPAPPTTHTSRAARTYVRHDTRVYSRQFGLSNADQRRPSGRAVAASPRATSPPIVRVASYIAEQLRRMVDGDTRKSRRGQPPATSLTIRHNDKAGKVIQCSRSGANLEPIYPAVMWAHHQSVYTNLRYFADCSIDELSLP